MMRLKDKVALVTGAEAGIGFAVAKLFVEEGATVFASDPAASNDRSPDVCALALDVTSELAWQSAVDRVIERSGRLDVLVNAAAAASYERLDELSVSSWMWSIALNQTGVFLGMREAVGVMRRQKAGAIVNIAPALNHLPAGEAYACHATTGAVRSMTRNAALACMTDNIRINVVLSGFVQPPMLCGVAPIQVAHGCLFLCSDEAGGISGAELAIDGSGPVAAPIL